MKLYGFPASPNTWKVRALASYVKVPLEFEFVDLTKGAQQAPAYLALNPTGRAPTLVDGDFNLWESNAILQYIAGKVSTPLWPNDARARADHDDVGIRGYHTAYTIRFGWWSPFAANAAFEGAEVPSENQAAGAIEHER